VKDVENSKLDWWEVSYGRGVLQSSKGDTLNLVATQLQHATSSV